MRSEQFIDINFNLSSEQASEFSELFKKRASEKLAQKYHKQGFCYLVIHNRKSEKENEQASEQVKQVLVFNYSEHIPQSTLRKVIWGASEKKSERVQSEKVQAFKALMQAILKANKLANTSENIEQVLKAHKIIASEQVIEFLASK